VSVVAGPLAIEYRKNIFLLATPHYKPMEDFTTKNTVLVALLSLIGFDYTNITEVRTGSYMFEYNVDTEAREIIEHWRSMYYTGQVAVHPDRFLKAYSKVRATIHELKAASNDN